MFYVYFHRIHICPNIISQRQPFNFQWIFYEHRSLKEDFSKSSIFYGFPYYGSNKLQILFSWGETGFLGYWNLISIYSILGAFVFSSYGGSIVCVCIFWSIGWFKMCIFDNFVFKGTALAATFMNSASAASSPIKRCKIIFVITN